MKTNKDSVYTQAMTRPYNVVGVVASSGDRRVASDRPNCAHVLEWRIDKFNGDDALKEVRELRLPLIVTVRDPNEGGTAIPGVTTEKERADVYRTHLKLAAWIDLEASTVEHEDILPLVEEAHEKGVGVIISFHHFEDISTLSRLELALRVCERVNGDVLKIAVTPKTWGDLVKFAGYIHLLKRRSDTPMSIMAMGKFGPISRPFFATDHSVFVYGRLGEEGVATGQLHVDDLKFILERVVPV